MPIPHFSNPKFRIRAIGQRMLQRRESHRVAKNWKQRIARLWLPVVGGFVALCIIGGVGLFAWYSRDLPDPDKIIDRTIAQSTKIYARDGKTLLYEIHGDEKRTVINLEDIPAYVKDATIAIEDKNFYTHKGFSLPGIAKAVCHEIVGNVGGLCPQRGGSTITQQFVKNTILTSERSYSRKLKELVLAYQLEKKFSKEQILKLYLNEIPYGSSSYGIESAAQTFFAKSAKDLTIDEAALLASLPQLPSYYSPYGSHTEDLVNRQKTILALMVEQGYITEEQRATAAAVDILAKIQPKREQITAPHFVFYIKEQLANKYGEKMVEQGGLNVITTINIDKQRIADEVVQKYGETNAKKYKASNAALVSIDTKTGQILAMVGSRDYFNKDIDGNVNVTLRPRQPGSSFKPFVYMTAFEKGFTPETILFDLVTTFKSDSGKDYTPHNYDAKEHGPLSMRQSLAGSLNIPAVKTLYLAGIDKVLDNAEKFGYTTFTDRSRYGLSLVLGGGEVTLLEHTSAYATLAREGIRHPVTGILKVADAKGKILEEYQDREERVMDENTVRLLTSVLSDNDARSYIFGSRNYLTLPDRPVAAKTGTTNDYRDAWTLGYTPSIATGVWVGNNSNSEMSRGADGSVVAAPIWNEYMRRTVGGPAEPFKAPKPNNATKPALQGKLEGETKMRVDRVTGKLIPESCLATYPTEFITEKTFRAVHDILYYVDKNNPTGPAPADPTKDPQFTAWEEPVRAWAQKNNYTESKPAFESCTLRAPENVPVVSFLSPASGSTISDGVLSATVSVTTPRTVAKVTYYLDEREITTVTTPPYILSLTVDTTLESGFHDLKAVAYDDVGNSGAQTMTVNYLPAGSDTTNANTDPVAP